MDVGHFLCKLFILGKGTCGNLLVDSGRTLHKKNGFVPPVYNKTCGHEREKREREEREKSVTYGYSLLQALKLSTTVHIGYYCDIIGVIHKCPTNIAGPTCLLLRDGDRK